jgi:hypothetical protein
MDRHAVEEIQLAIDAARQAAQNGQFDSCDMSDLEEIIAPVESELRTTEPNKQTLSTYLNSLAKSLRANPSNRALCLQIDAAMRQAGVPTHWEH